MPHRLPGKRVLVVEDNPALAYDIDDALSDCGVLVLGPALTLLIGMDLLRESVVDGAVLDIDLDGQLVWPLARELKKRHIPFVFVSADCGSRLPADLCDSTCVPKPALSCNILFGVSEAMAAH